MLGRFGLQLARGSQIGDQRQVDQRRIARSQLITQLTHRLDKGQRLDVAHRTADLGDDDIELLALSEQLDSAFDLIGDMGYDLYGFAQIIALTLLLNHTLVDTSRRNVVGMAGRNRSETLIVPQVKVRLCAVLRHVALAVFIRVQCSRVDVDIRIQFLNRHRVTARLQQSGDRGRYDSLAERRSDTARYENVLGFTEFHYLFEFILYLPYSVCRKKRAAFKRRIPFSHHRNRRLLGPPVQRDYSSLLF